MPLEGGVCHRVCHSLLTLILTLPSPNRKITRAAPSHPTHQRKKTRRGRPKSPARRRGGARRGEGGEGGAAARGGAARQCRYEVRRSWGARKRCVGCARIRDVDAKSDPSIHVRELSRKCPLSLTSRGGTTSQHRLKATLIEEHQSLQNR